MEASAVPDQLTFDDIVGGEEPTVHRLTVSGVKLELREDELPPKGGLVKIELTCRADAILFADKHDSATDEVVDTIQTAKCRFVSGAFKGPVGDLKAA